ANPEAVVVGAKEGRRNASSDAEKIQAIHDHAASIGATCPSGGKAATRPSIGSKTVDEAGALLADADTSDLPESVQQAITLLLDLLGNLEPEPDESQPAAAADSTAATGAAVESAAADVALRTHRL